MSESLKNYVGFGFKVERDKSGKFWNFVIRCSVTTAKSVFSGGIPDFIRPYPLYIHDIDRQSLSLIAYAKHKGVVSKHAVPVIVEDGEVFITCPYKPWMQLREFVSERAQHFISSLGVVKLIMPAGYGPYYLGRPYGDNVKAKYVKNHMDLLNLNEAQLELIEYGERTAVQHNGIELNDLTLMSEEERKKFFDENPELFKMNEEFESKAPAQKPVSVTNPPDKSIAVTTPPAKSIGRMSKPIRVPEVKIREYDHAGLDNLSSKTIADLSGIQVFPERLLIKSDMGSHRVARSEDLDVIGLLFRKFLEDKPVHMAYLDDWYDTEKSERSKHLQRLNSHLKYIGLVIDKGVSGGLHLTRRVTGVYKDDVVRRSAK